MNKLFDFNHPFFKPLWVRILVTGACLGWGMIEFMVGTPVWGALFCGLGVVAAYGLFVTFDPEKAEQAGKEDKRDV